jgi:hypothetical protein
MQVRMDQSLDLATGRTATAGLRAGLSAKQELSEPEGESLFAYPGRSNHHQDLRQTPGRHRFGDPLPGFLMADEVMHRHGLKVGREAGER